jgi:hypothetical protein
MNMLLEGLNAARKGLAKRPGNSRWSNCNNLGLDKATLAACRI